MDDPTMKDETLLTHANFGSVKRVFVIAKADTSNTEEMQRQTVDLSPGTDVEEIAGADHMAMLSKPTEVCEVLVRIADRCHWVEILFADWSWEKNTFGW